MPVIRRASFAACLLAAACTERKDPMTSPTPTGSALAQVTGSVTDTQREALGR